MLDIKKHKNRIEKELQQLQPVSNRLSAFRLLFFSGVLLFFAFIFIFKSYLFFSGCVFCFIIFCYLAIKHAKVEGEINLLTKQQQVISEYDMRIKLNFASFSSNGLNYYKQEEYMVDLNIIGDNSLFLLLDATATYEGGANLYRFLGEHVYCKDRTTAVSELSKKEEFTVALIGGMKVFKDYTATKKLNTTLPLSTPKKAANWHSVIYIAFLLNCVIGVLSLFSVIHYGYFLATALLLLALNSLALYQNKSIMDNGPYFQSFSALEKAIDIVTAEHFASAKLIDAQAVLSEFNQIGMKEIKKLKMYESFIRSFISYLFLNLILPFNSMFIRTFQKHADGATLSKGVIDGIALIESYVSLSILAQIKNDTVVANVTTVDAVSFKDVKHPLIPEDKCVANSVNNLKNVSIITGSNMSGKTSFLRTIGINITLALAGCAVCGKQASFPAYRIITSIGASDNLAAGISTFYAELLRLKDVINYKGKQPLIVLVDEIFKGTNSNDRLLGGKKLIRKLNELNITTVITTHDFEFAEEDVVNYHFAEHYIKNEIHFDYKLKSGVCPTTNALALMKHIGIE